MNPYHRAVRAALAGMERGRALQWLTAHPLDQEERDCIAEIDVYGHGAVQAADRLFLSAETVKRQAVTTAADAAPKIPRSAATR